MRTAQAGSSGTQQTPTKEANDMTNESTSKQRMHKTSVGIELKEREELVTLLNAQLADTSDLYSQTKQAHWNVKGIDFMQLHLLFDQLAEGVFPFVDMIAERITALGGTAYGTVRMASASSSLKEYPVDAIQGEAHLKNLIERYSAYGSSSRASIETSNDKYGDQATADLFTEITRQIDQYLYFLESHLQTK